MLHCLCAALMRQSNWLILLYEALELVYAVVVEVCEVVMRVYAAMKSLYNPLTGVCEVLMKIYEPLVRQSNGVKLLSELPKSLSAALMKVYYPLRRSLF